MNHAARGVIFVRAMHGARIRCLSVEVVGDHTFDVGAILALRCHERATDVELTQTPGGELCASDIGVVEVHPH